MKVCRTLSVTGTAGSLQGFFKDIRQRRPRGWRQEAALGEDLSIFQRTPGGCPGDHMVVFGFIETTCLIVANVHTTPDWPGDFTMELFNEILLHFAEAIRPFVAKWGVTMKVGDSQGDIANMMAPPTYSALQAFAAQQGQVDTLGEMAWSRFLTFVHLEKCLVRPPEIAEWLRGQGWSEPASEHWAREFTRGLSLLDVREALASQVKVVHLNDLPTASAHVQ